jgi:hypothetical protein
MLPTVRPRRAGTARLLLGLVFLGRGARRREGGGPLAFVPIGIIFVVVGLRRLTGAAWQTRGAGGRWWSGEGCGVTAPGASPLRTRVQ